MDRRHVAHDHALHMTDRRLHVFAVDPRVAHVGVREAHELTRVGRIGHDFLVPGHGRVEDNFPDDRACSAKREAFHLGAIRENNTCVGSGEGGLGPGGRPHPVAARQGQGQGGGEGPEEGGAARRRGERRRGLKRRNQRKGEDKIEIMIGSRKRARERRSRVGEEIGRERRGVGVARAREGWLGRAGSGQKRAVLCYSRRYG